MIYIIRYGSSVHVAHHLSTIDHAFIASGKFHFNLLKINVFMTDKHETKINYLSKRTKINKTVSLLWEKQIYPLFTYISALLSIHIIPQDQIWYNHFNHDGPLFWPFPYLQAHANMRLYNTKRQSNNNIINGFPLLYRPPQQYDNAKTIGTSKSNNTFVGENLLNHRLCGCSHVKFAYITRHT